MIASIEDAWRWCENARRYLQLMKRLGQQHWESLPWEGALGRDDQLRNLLADEVVGGTEVVLDDLNDQCVLVLFSVFEATVRDHVLASMREESDALVHPALRHAAESVAESIEHGSFFKVLEPYKAIDANLVEEVNQVRRYRNWAAHGRRGMQPIAITPAMALDRLRRFLDRFIPPAPRP